MANDRLSKNDWLKAGLGMLASSGVQSLKAEVLAKSLGVSRGSFYWHFTDVAAFHAALLTAWEEIATYDIIQAVESEGGDAIAKLRRLARLVFSYGGSLERQIRAWAAQASHAAEAQDRVDQQRLAYVVKLLTSTGQTDEEAALRARVMYLALLGQYVVGPSRGLNASDAERFVDVLVAPKS
jgi:AcrR family transcriptional regulator